eukprot:GHVR01087743.1.p1 GENE.GHVR01087743.1~~GHVR01087743.1.p1  ORF type:complete len:142 (+),score=5.51 GHVR01087743.1:492-917(+)
MQKINSQQLDAMQKMHYQQLDKQLEMNSRQLDVSIQQLNETKDWTKKLIDFMVNKEVFLSLTILFISTGFHFYHGYGPKQWFNRQKNVRSLLKSTITYHDFQNLKTIETKYDFAKYLEPRQYNIRLLWGDPGIGKSTAMYS